MSHPLSNTPVTEESEITLAQLFSESLRAIHQRSILFVSCLIIGAASGSLLYHLYPKVYVSSLTIKSEILTLNELLVLLSTLEDLIEKDQYNKTGAKMNLQVETVRHIKRITSDKPLGKEAVCKIIAEVYDINVLDSLQEGILSYFENNEYTQNKLKTKSESLNKVVQKINLQIEELENLSQQIQELEQLKKNENLLLTHEGQGVISIKSGNHSNLAALYEKRSGLEQQLKIKGSVQVMESFAPPR